SGRRSAAIPGRGRRTDRPPGVRRQAARLARSLSPGSGTFPDRPSGSGGGGPNSGYLDLSAALGIGGAVLPLVPYGRCGSDRDPGLVHGRLPTGGPVAAADPSPLGRDCRGRSRRRRACDRRKMPQGARQARNPSALSNRPPVGNVTGHRHRIPGRRDDLWASSSRLAVTQRPQWQRVRFPSVSDSPNLARGACAEFAASFRQPKRRDCARTLVVPVRGVRVCSVATLIRGNGQRSREPSLRFNNKPATFTEPPRHRSDPLLAHSSFFRRSIMSRTPNRRTAAHRRAQLHLEAFEGRSLPSGIVMQTNLVSDLPGVAAVQDPNLVNPWGISESPGGPFWISDNNAGVSTLYSVPGANNTPVSINPLVVSIPTPDDPLGASGTPTGTVFNIDGGATGGFKVSG